MNKRGAMFGMIIGIGLVAFIGFLIATKWATGEFFGTCVSNPAFDLSGICKSIKITGVVIGGIIGVFIGRFIPL